MPPVRLSDSELQAVFDACRPLQPRDRDQFLKDIAAELARAPILGDGVVFRTIREVVRRHYDAPDLRAGSGKYD
jgi:hypothetical protein